MGWKKINIFSYNKLQVEGIDEIKRDKNIIKQIAGSSFLRFASIGISLLTIPFVLDLLGKEQFALWITIHSIASWITITDIGIGNGLRNKLVVAFSKGDQLLAKKYVSTAYVTLGAIVGGITLVFVVGSFFLDWQAIFKIKSIQESIIRDVVLIIVCSIMVNFVLSLVNQVINALQRNALTALNSILANILFLTAIFVFKDQLHNNFYLMAIVYGVTLIIGVIIVSLFLFTEYPEVTPNIKYFQKKYIEDILSLGLKFFVLQIAGVIIFSTDNIVITQTIGLVEVTGYNLTLKIYSTFIMFFGVIMGPLWSAYTEAYIKGDLEWIRKRLMLQNKLMLLFVVLILIITLCFKFILNLWIQKPIDIPFYLPGIAAIYALISTWNNIYCTLLGGINKVRLSAIIAAITALINIPICVLLVKNTDLGSAGVLLGTIISLSVTALISPLQVYYFIYSNKKRVILERILS